MGIMSNLFNLKAKPTEQRFLLEMNTSFSSFGGTVYGNAVFRSAVDTIARHAAKLRAHTPSPKLDRLLQTTPNAYMSGFDLLYKTATAYFTTNNAFILLQRMDSGEIEALYPLVPSSAEFKAATDGALYITLSFPDGKRVTFDYNDVIHLRRHFYGNDLLGDGNAPLFPILETSQTLNEGIRASVRNGTNIRGVLKFTSLVNPAQVKAEKDAFVQDYFNPSNSGGVAATDQRFDFVPTNTAQYAIPREQTEAVNRQIYDYLGVSQKIVSGEYNENEFAAFYESIIEPLALQMSLEFTNKVFSSRERSFGNEVTFTSERLEFSSAVTKIKLLHEAAPLGLMTLNEARKLLALPPVPDGDKRLQSLNYIAADKADNYQLESEEQDNGKTSI